MSIPPPTGSGDTSYKNVSHDYSDSKKTSVGKVPKFNGDAEEFSWWKTNFYSYIMSLDEELWDILEDGVGDLVLDEEGAAVDRKKHTPELRKLYKKHHIIRGALVTAIPKAEYMKMSDISTAKSMFASLCSNYEGNKKVKEAKALMLVHQYELFKMKDDETIEEMYSRFQTLVSGLQILKKSYVASDHVSKILRSLPARWRPKVTAIEEAKDLNTLSVEDLVSSLKVHELSLNEHESTKKSKSIALPSKGKSSKALKVVESEEEEQSSSDSEPDAAEMAMLSNRLQYLAKKNRKFLSRRGNSRSSRKEDQKGCFNCKKPGHFIAECPDLQREKSKDKSKRSTFKPSKFKKQIKQSLMATWDDLGSESGSDKEEADEDAKVAVGLVATATSEAGSDSDSEDENEVYSKIPRDELVESLKELLTHFEVRTNELKDLKEKYADLVQQQKSTLLDLKASEQGLRGFDFMCKTYEDQLRFLCQKLQEKCNEKPLSNREIALEDFIISGIDRSRVASMIYSIYKNNGRGIGFPEVKLEKTNLKSCCECIKEGLKTFFVPEGAELETVVQSEPEASSSKAKITSKPKNSKSKAMIKSDSKTSKVRILKRSEPIPQSLVKPKSGVLKSKFQKKTVTASEVPKPKVMVNQKQPNSQHKVQEVKSKALSTNLPGPIEQWVPKSKNVNDAGMSKSSAKAKIMVPRQRLLKTHDRRQVHVPQPNNERGRKCEIWRQPVRQDHRYRNYW